MAGNHATHPGQAVLLIRDLGGRLRGLGVLADPAGTVVTAHEVVAGLDRVVLHTESGQTSVLGSDGIELLPDQGLAVLSTGAVGGLPGQALPIARESGGLLVAVPYVGPEDGAPGLLQGGVLGRATAMYPCGDEFHLVRDALLLELSGTPTPGAPVLDAETGAVLAVAAPGLQSRHPGVVAAAPLGGAPLAALLARNGAAVAAFGRALNLGGVLRLASVQLGAAVAGPGRIADLAADRVDRSDGLTGEEPQHQVTVLIGAPGSGRTTELAALTVRRAGGGTPLPTLWLRGADLEPADRSLAEAVGRALAGAAALLDVPAPGAETVARLCTAAGRPLLVVLDSAAEARFGVDEEWLAATREWLGRSGARLVTACRPDGSERLAVDARVHWLGPLPPDAAARAARRYGLPSGGPDSAWAAHPVALRLAGELHSAGVRGSAAAVEELYEAFVDLCCLRIARRLVAAAGPRRPGAHRRGGRPPAGEDAGLVRRLAAVAAGRVHEAARLMLGSGDGGLGTDEFSRLFEGEWGRAVLEAGLLVRVGDGYRAVHEELAEWLQGLHLDLDRALRLVLADGPSDGAERGGHGPAPLAGAVPRHRAEVVAAALRRVGVVRGAEALDVWLHRLRLALDHAERGSGTDWWAGRLLAAVLPTSPRPAVHRALVLLLAERAGDDGRFGPAFWASLPLDPADRLALLRCLVPVDESYRASVEALLTADPVAVIPALCGWLEDASAVAEPAAELLYRHRTFALDELADALVAAAHPRADELLGRLAAEEPSALCRAVDRWSHDPRPERHVAAAVHGLRAAPYATGPGSQLLRHTALTLLAREDEPALHGAALALLVRDPATRAEHLPAALAVHRAGDPFVTAEALAPALADHPDEVLAAFRDRLSAPGAALAEGLRLLAEAADPAVVRRGALIAAELLRERPERAGQLADYLDRLLVRGQDGRPLLAVVLTAEPPVRRAFALVLATPAEPARARLLDTVLAVERDPAVLGAVVERLAERWADHEPERLGELLRRIAVAWDGADALLVRCAGRMPGFAELLARRPGAERGGHHTGAVPVPEQRRAHGTL